jgi:rare lipoprotein A
MEKRLHDDRKGSLFEQVRSSFELMASSAIFLHRRHKEEPPAMAARPCHIVWSVVLATLTGMWAMGCGIGNVQSRHTSQGTGYHSRVVVGSREREPARGKPLGPTHIVASSWYGPGYDGRRTSSGERFDPKAFTAASNTIPLGSTVRVTNPKNGRSTQVKVNDRGPAVKGRTLDLSTAAARKIGVTKSGVARVEITPVE